MGQREGEVVKTAREAVEERLGAPVVSKQNYLDLTEPDALEAPDGQGLLGE